MPVVKLTSAEMMTAGLTGVIRRVSSLQNEYNSGIYHAHGNEWSTDIDGAAAEMAVAKHLNKYWGSHVNSMKAPDVDTLQVRSTHHKNGCLIIRPHDNPDAKYVLVTSAAPEYNIVGWMWGRDAMQDKFWRTDLKGLDAWWVPQQQLIEM